MTNAVYQSETGKVFWCMIAKLILAIVTVIVTLVAVAGTVAAIGSGGKEGVALAGGAIAALIISAVAGIALAVIVFMAFNNLQKDFGVDTPDGRAFGNLKIAALLDLVIAAVGILSALAPAASLLFSIINLILGIIAYVLYLMGYSALKKSETFPGADGAGTVFTAYVLILIAAVLAVIPVINVIGSILSIIGLIMLLVGWSKIKNAQLPTE